MRAIERLLRSRWLPAMCGALAFGLVLFVWGSLAKLPVGNDESAYLLQSSIFATGRIVAPARPIPVFFQQYHVFVEPVLAAKYPPGHSLLLAPGVWLGLPGLIPALLVAFTAAILCLVTRKLTNGATAVLAVILAVTSDIALRFDASYFSETTTAAVFVVAWWTLLEYWESGRRRWIIACAAAVGWGAITRPYTMAPFGIPAAVCALLAMRRHRSWRDLVPASALGLLIVLILPAWNWSVLGHWQTMTQAAYAKRYLPADGLGFGANPTLPTARLSVEEQAANEVVVRMHRGYTLASLPAAAADRAANIIRGSWSFSGLPGLAVLIGAALLPVAVSRTIVLTLVCVFIAYLGYAHDPTWTLYYLEFQAPLALLTAAGVWGFTRWLSRLLAKRSAALQQATIQRFVFVALSLALVGPALGRVRFYRGAHASQREYHERFQRAVAALPNAPSIVFVRYAPGHGEERLVENVPDLGSASPWIVHDCGADNRRLLAFAPSRVPYVYREWIGTTGLSFALTPLVEDPTRRIAISEETC